jgi:hypothetical protein
VGSSSDTDTHPDNHGAAVTQAVAACKAKEDKTSTTGSEGIGQCVSAVASENGSDHGSPSGGPAANGGKHGKSDSSH